VDSDAWPDSPEAAAALVALVLAEILGGDHGAREALLESFMKTAWPSGRAARQ
jgi:hypothetical protein